MVNRANAQHAKADRQSAGIAHEANERATPSHAANGREPVTEDPAERPRAAEDGRCLPDLLRARVRERPDAVAVVCGTEELTYRELAEHATELAGYLRHLGVGADDCVGLFVEPSTDLMVGAWGILLGGGAYLPLSPGYPEERLRYMIEDSRTAVVVAQEELRERLVELAPAGTTIVTLADARHFAAGLPPAQLPDPGAEHLAYVIYTSGSTGRPKGVMIEHRAIVSQMRWLAAAYGLDEDRVVLQKTPMSFDAAQWEILAPACGSRVVMGAPGIYRDPERLIETITAYGVTTLQCVPTLLQALLDTDQFAECATLRQVFSGGEALSRALATQCLAALPGCDLVNLYGPTECTINSSAFTVDRATVADGPSSIPIGTPVDGVRYHILDADRSPVPVGEIGELYIGGVQLARGYLHRPDLTAERFIDEPWGPGHAETRLYRTGDLASWQPDGTVLFAGRTDNQVKLRGFRVELDEIRRAIETHDWVKNAAVVVRGDPRTRFQNLIAFIELNPKEAALMDQGNHSAHHQSKQSRVQIRAQLSNGGSRDAEELAGKPVTDLPGRHPTPEQRRRVFARKTYRFFEGGEVTRADILRLLDAPPPTADPRDPAALGLGELGEILRYFGQYASDERLLPKYGYASPGALYATQLYLELDGIAGLRPGYYYHHPVHHQLVLIQEKEPAARPGLRLHFMGKRRAIEPVYKNNILEVLEIETGHMVGLFEEILPGHGLDIRPLGYTPDVAGRLECASEDYYLGTFEVIAHSGTRPADALDVYVQAHPGKIADLPGGLYRYDGGELTRIGDDIVLQRQVIAINQQVYARSSFGVSLVSRTDEPWLSYVDLGRGLHRLQANDLGLGFMSSGYSSKTGHDLPSARRLTGVLAGIGAPGGASYFFVGGRVSDAQRESMGMGEDVVHMKGPTEMIRDDLITFLPDYMMPNKVVVLDRLPLTANGKIDTRALAELDMPNLDPVDRPFIAPRTATEERIGRIWRAVMRQDDVSVQDDFFESGGNSLLAVGLVNRINKEFQGSLPLQVLFDAPTVEKLALRVDSDRAEPASRAVPLRSAGSREPIFCWPGLGGYVMNLRLLAGRVDLDRPFYGIQAHGINRGEEPYPTITAMAAEDVRVIRRLQPTGPYTLWGYSFGARVAFETAYQLERAGERVENLFLIAPGSPRVGQDGGEHTYDNRVFLTILFSVFGGAISGPLLDECLSQVRDEEGFAAFISGRFPHLDADLVKRITRVVDLTYQFTYDFRELRERRVTAPITVFKATGDDYSFLESATGYAEREPTVFDLDGDHYGILKEAGVDELVQMIRRRLGVEPLAAGAAAG